MNLSSEYHGFCNFEYVIYSNYFVCKSIDIDIINCSTNTPKVKNGLETPQIFHCYWVICCKISVSDVKMVRSLAVYVVYL